MKILLFERERTSDSDVNQDIDIKKRELDALVLDGVRLQFQK